MKLKKLALVLVVVLMASTFAPALAKNPFADVPADHWAYDSIVQLAAAGLIEGYPDGTYGGARMMTRYEAAMVFARALSRLETQIGNIDLLPELDKVKAELMAEIKAQLAAAGTPVVETKVVEKVIVDKDVDEATLARIRANEIAAEAIEGDMAYLEARMLGLVDGIRFDVNKLKEQVAGIEVPSMEEIEALIAASVEEGLVKAAAGVKETTIVERVVATTPELTEADVELIAEALINAQLQKYDILVRENRELIVGLYDRVDALEANAVTKEDLAALKAELSKVKFSGTLTFEGKHASGEPALALSQKADINLHIKASDTVDVKAWTKSTITPHTFALSSFSDYGVEITSKTPISRLAVGNLAPSGTSSYVVSGKRTFAGVADVDIIDGLKLSLYAGQKAGTDIKTALALNYKFSNALNVKLTGAADKPVTGMFKNYGAGLGLFGKVADVNYNLNFAMDFATAKTKNFIVAGDVKTTVAGITVDAAGAYQEDDYKIARIGVDPANAKWNAEAGVAASPAGIALAGRYYHETDKSKANTVGAYILTAKKTFDLGVDVTASARYAGELKGATAKNNIFAKLALDKKFASGLSLGASGSYEKNVLALDDDGNPIWKNNSKYADGTDKAVVKGNVGYALNWGGAAVKLGYDATLDLPLQPVKGPNTLAHALSLGYDFTSNVKLTLGAGAKHGLTSPITPAYNYNAKVTVSF